jgi:hypothetical protein
MRQFLVTALILALSATLAPAQQNRIGAGAHYWKTLDKIDSEHFDESGLGWVVSYQRKGGEWTKLELDLEILPDGYGGSTNTAYSPQLFLLIGKGVYVGAGVGIDYLNDEFADEPFYILRLGFDVPLLPSLFLDVNANYQFLEFKDIKTLDETIDTDVITLGAQLRLEF